MGVPPPDASPHKVQRGDHICDIAQKVWKATNWRTVWESPTNKDLRDARQNPNLLYDGDVVHAPLPPDQNVPGQTEVENKSVMENLGLFLRLRILKEDRTPLAKAKFTLKMENETQPPFGKKNPREGTTDDQGQIQEEISKDADHATLTVQVPPTERKNEEGEIIGDTPVTWRLWIGALYSIEGLAPSPKCIPGIQQRLNNLGFDCGHVVEPDKALEPNGATKAAMRAFCKAYGLNESCLAEADLLTLRLKLRDVHDMEAK